MISTKELELEIGRLIERRRFSQFITEQTSLDGSILTVKKLIELSEANDKKHKNEV